MFVNLPGKNSEKQALANCLIYSFNLILYSKPYLHSGGTDTHLFLLDLHPNGIDGIRAEKVLQDCAIGCMRNPCPSAT